MSLHLKIKRLNNLFEEEEHQDMSFQNLIQNNYLVNKIKEILFKLVPDLNNASKKIVSFCMKLVEFLYNKLIEEKDDKLNEGLMDTISNVFSSLYDILSNIFTGENSQILTLDKTVLDKNSIEINEFLKENINEDSSILIRYDEVETINDICEIKEIKLFAVKTDKNYICMPLDDKDFKGFKAVAMTKYYQAYYQVPDDIFKEINDLILEFSEFLKNDQNFKKDKEYKFHNLKVRFEYEEDMSKIHYAGYYASSFKRIVIPFQSFNAFKNRISGHVNTLIHEYIHHMDDVRNKDAFTNWDVSELFNKIFNNYDKNDIIDLKELQKKLQIKDDSAFRYLIGLMQKNKYIHYVNLGKERDFTKIKLTLDTELGSPPSNGHHQDVNYFNDPVELNTHVTTKLNRYLIALIYDNEDIKTKISILGNAKDYISSEVMNLELLDFPYSVWEKIDKFINDTPNIIQIANKDISVLNQYINGKKIIPDSIQNKLRILKQLNVFKNLNLLSYDYINSQFINLFNKKDDVILPNSKKYKRNVEPFVYIKELIQNIFINKKYLRSLKKVRNFKNNDFSDLIAYIKQILTDNEDFIEESANEYAKKQTNIYKRQLFGNNYKDKKGIDVKVQEKINNYFEQIKINYLEFLNEKVDDGIKQVINYMKNKYEEENRVDLDLTDYMENDNENKKNFVKSKTNINREKIEKKNDLTNNYHAARELQTNSLLRQYISLLVT